MMTELREKMYQFSQIIAGMTASRRAALLITSLATMSLLIYFLALQPLTTAKKSYTEKLATEKTTLTQINNNLLLLNQSIEQLTASNTAAPTAEQSTHTTQSSEPKFSNQLISPSDMTTVLEELMTILPNVKITRLENLPAAELTDIVGLTGITSHDIDNLLGAKVLANGIIASLQDNGGFSLYKHGLRLKATGEYKDLVRFIRHFEQLPRNIIWGELALKSVDYPKCELLITVYTFSLNENWIGV